MAMFIMPFSIELRGFPFKALNLAKEQNASVCENDIIFNISERFIL